MSAISKTVSCPSCGRTFKPADKYHVEPIIEFDQPLRWVPVHDGEHIYKMADTDE